MVQEAVGIAADEISHPLIPSKIPDSLVSSEATAGRRVRKGDKEK